MNKRKLTLIALATTTIAVGFCYSFSGKTDSTRSQSPSELNLESLEKECIPEKLDSLENEIALAITEITQVTQRVSSQSLGVQSSAQIEAVLSKWKEKLEALESQMDRCTSTLPSLTNGDDDDQQPLDE